MKTKRYEGLLFYLKSLLKSYVMHLLFPLGSKPSNTLFLHITANSETFSPVMSITYGSLAHFGGLIVKCFEIKKY